MNMTNYPAGDFLIRLKNASRAGLQEVTLRNTKLIEAVAEVLKKEGYLAEVSKQDGQLTVKLAYKSKNPRLTNIQLVSKLGLRIYKNAAAIKSHKGASLYIISTSAGVISSREAVKKGIGGEVIAEIW
jgi:small subunit ribosomal protein S8